MQQTIKEASEHTGLSAHTIRYYEREGLIPFLARDKNNTGFLIMMPFTGLNYSPVYASPECPLRNKKKLLN